jgi:threonine dehydratase
MLTQLFSLFCPGKGDDFGRVLVGIQVPSNDDSNDKLFRFLDTLHFDYVEETDNPIYHKFLRSES